MLQSLLSCDIQPILSQRGAYCWNDQVSCTMDVIEFDNLYHQAANLNAPLQNRIDFYHQALSLYKGDLLPRLSEQMWVMSLSAHYHKRFLEAAKTLADLLEQTQNFEEMHEIAVRANTLDRLDEGLHVRIIRALIGQNEITAALKHFDLATDLLYRGLKVRPSEELRALYHEMMNTKKSAKFDLTLITEDLRKTAEREGAFLCPYGTL